MDQSRAERRKERDRTLKVRVRAGCRRLSAHRQSSSGGRNRTCVPPVNSRVLVPARTPPESSSSRQTVGMAGFEPAISCSQGRRISQAFPHPESPRSPISAQRESNPHVRHGKAVGYRYIMGTITVAGLSASSPCGNRTHLSALKGRYPQPIDERAGVQEWAGGLESPSAGLQPAARPSQLPTHSVVPTKKTRCLRHTGPETPREGCSWPGVTSARDRAGAGSPMNRRIVSLLGNPGRGADSRRT